MRTLRDRKCGESGESEGEDRKCFTDLWGRRVLANRWRRRLEMAWSGGLDGQVGPCPRGSRYPMGNGQAGGTSWNL